MKHIPHNRHRMSRKTFQSFLDYYFEGFPLGNVAETYRSLQACGFSTKQLTDTMEHFQPYIPAIENILGQRPTQANLFGYAVELFLDENWDWVRKTDDRRNISYLLRGWK